MRPRPEDLSDREAVNARFAREVDHFDLRFQCRDCTHVHPTAGRCSLEYPNDLLRGPIEVISPAGALAFCKYFELGEQA